MALCSDPYMDGDVPRPCGRCLPCLKGRAWRWTSRIILETFNHENNAFITLTYNEDYLPDQHPETDAMVYPTLRPDHLRNYIKRIRRACPDAILRYYAVGEYGDRSWRPHYHIALFNYPPCHHGGTRRDRHAKGKSCCPPCDLLHEKWYLDKTDKTPMGGIDNALLEPASAAYIAGYITKKLYKPENAALHGRFPEFSRMSRCPGLGALSAEKLVPLLETDIGKEGLTEHGDTPTTLSFGEQALVLDRYLREVIRKNLNMEEIYDTQTGEIKYLPKVKTEQAFSEEMRTLYENYWNDGAPKAQKMTRRQFVLDRDAQKIKNLTVKHNLKKKENRL